MGVPGVGLVIAVRFVAVVDQPERFHSAHHLMSYIGLTPGENSSSLRSHRTAITKAGASDLRHVLVQGVAGRCCGPNHASPWCSGLSRWRRDATRQIAVVALARKLVGILWVLWRDGTRYCPDKAAAPVHC